MKNSKLMIIVLILAVGILSGCAGGKTVEPTSAPTDMALMETAAPTTSGAPVIGSPSPSGEGIAVEIVDFAFAPETLTVKVGTTVTWTNNDSVGHTATSDTGVFDSHNLSKGESYSFTFTTAGTYAYHCTPHPYMVATIVVTE